MSLAIAGGVSARLRTMEDIADRIEGGRPGSQQARAALMKRAVVLLLLVLAACATESAPGWRGGVAAFHKAIAACEADPAVDVEACMKRGNYVRVLDHGCPSGADARKLRDTACWGQFDPDHPEVLTGGRQLSN